MLPAAPIDATSDQTVVWTGRELVVWGGTHGATAPGAGADGAAYDPTTGRWRRLARAPLSFRSRTSAVWTGAETFIWGGHGAGRDSDGSTQDRQDLNDGAAYDAAHDRWRQLAASPLSPRHGADAVWTGREVVVIGGRAGEEDAPLTDGATYDPRNNRWTRLPSFPLSSEGEPVSATAVWTGHELPGWVTSEVDQLTSGGGVSIWARTMVASWTPGSPT